MGPLFGKKPLTKSFSEIIILLNFKHSCCSNLMQKSFMMYLRLLMSETSFIATWNLFYCHFLAEKLQNKFIPKKSFTSVLSLSATVTSCKTSKKIHTLNFDNTTKISFWSHFRPLSAQKPPSRVFSKKDICINFQPICCCIFSHKIRIVTCTAFW